MQVVQWQCGIIAFLSAWLNLMNMVNQLPWFSIIMPVTKSFVLGFVKVFSYILMLLCAFAYTFHLLLMNRPAFQSLFTAVVKSVVWLRGDLGYDDTFLDEENDLPYPIMTNLLFVVFVTTVSSFIINLILTLPSSKLNDIRDGAAFNREECKCKLFLKYDICFPSYSKRKNIGILIDDDFKTNVFTRNILMLGSKAEETVSPDSLLLKLEDMQREMQEFRNQWNASTRRLSTLPLNEADYYEMNMV